MAEQTKRPRAVGALVRSPRMPAAMPMNALIAVPQMDAPADVLPVLVLIEDVAAYVAQHLKVEIPTSSAGFDGARDEVEGCEVQKVLTLSLTAFFPEITWRRLPGTCYLVGLEPAHGSEALRPVAVVAGCIRPPVNAPGGLS